MNNKPLTWEEVANIYDSKRRSSRPARTLPMDKIFDWVAKQDGFYVGEDDYLYHKEEE